MSAAVSAMIVAIASIFSANSEQGAAPSTAAAVARFNVFLFAIIVSAYGAVHIAFTVAFSLGMSGAASPRLARKMKMPRMSRMTQSP